MRSVRLIGLIPFVAVLCSTVAQGQTVTVNLPAVAATPRSASFHNDLFDPQCPAFASTIVGEELKGNLSASQGSFFLPVLLPQGATVTSFRFFARDFSDGNAHAFLVRKKTIAGASAFVSGAYRTMAEAHTSGAADPIRRFDDNTINSGILDNVDFTYLVEFVSCDPTIELISAQIVYTP